MRINFIKRVVSIFLICSLILVVTGCADKPQSNNNSSDDSEHYHISIDNTSPVQSNYNGQGAYYASFSCMNDVTGKPGTVIYSDEQIEWEMECVRRSGVNVVRTMFMESWAWDPATGDNVENVKVNWDTDDMKCFYKWLDKMTEMKIDVMVSFGWTMGALGKTAVERNIPVFQYMSGSSNYFDCIPYYAQFYSDFVKEVIVKRGYNCIKYANIMTEPDYNPAGDVEANSHEHWQQWYTAAEALHNKLVKDGVRQSIKLLGAQSVRDNDWVKWTVEEADDIIDIYTAHRYPTVDSYYEQGALYDQVYYKAKEWVDTVRPTGKDFWWDEIQVFTKNEPDTEMHPKYQGAQEVLAISAMMNAGVSKNLLWMLAKQKYPNNFATYTEFVEGVQTTTGFLGYLNWDNTPEPVWYAYSMVANALNHPEQSVYEIIPENDIYGTLSVSEDGTVTLIAVNMSLEDQEISFDFEKSFDDITLYRYCYDPSIIEANAQVELIKSSGKFINVYNTITDKIPSFGVTVYTSSKF